MAFPLTPEQSGVATYLEPSCDVSVVGPHPALDLQTLEGDAVHLDDIGYGASFTGVVHVENRPHTVRITNPQYLDHEGPQRSFVLLPGFSESIEHGPGGELHAALADRNRT